MKTLVIGATGRVAGALASRLAEEGTSVRALVRDREKAAAALGDAIEIVDGAFDDRSVLARAFADVDSVFLALGTSQEQVALEKGLIDGAKLAGVPQLVRLSVLGADKARDTAFYEVARRHGELDAYLAASGVPHTILRPSYFMSNFLTRAPMIAGNDRWFGAAPTGRVSMIDTRDVADAAACILQKKELQNAAYELTGAEALGFPDVAETFSKILGRKISYVALDDATLRSNMAARVPAWLADIAVGIDLAIEAGLQSRVTDTFESLTGSAPRSLGNFIRDHKTAFSAAA
jgi:uncharacterized protein YbjT (DUF2867 family)